MTTLTKLRGVRIAIEGCGHGTLDAIYASVAASCAKRGWPGVDLVVIGGDFQAARNASDLLLMSVPAKYRAMGDFHKYYAGKRVAPYPTLFVGGNHEAAAHLWELFYGGWAAPNIYYMGAANVLRIGPLRIAGLSGIWNGRDYRRPHGERLPFRQDDVRSFYHQREQDVRKLLLIREPVDIGLSHDWPRGIERDGDTARLLRFKPHFRSDAETGQLGSVAAEYILHRLRPRFWFSAHLHCKFAAVKTFPRGAEADAEPADAVDAEEPEKAAETLVNPDEIDLDDEAGVQETPVTQPTKETPATAPSGVDGVSSELLARLPASFHVPPSQAHSGHNRPMPGQPVPPTITNTRTDFLALDKCLPGRHFLQLMEIGAAEGADDADVNDGHGSYDANGAPVLGYDPEWLAITRAFHGELVIGDRTHTVPPDLGETVYRARIDAERAWVDEHIVAAGKLAVPHDFCRTAPVYAPVPGRAPTFATGPPAEYTNASTAAFCALLEIPNLWDATKQERRARIQRGPGASSPRRGRSAEPEQTH